MEFYQTLEDQITGELEDPMTYRKLHTYINVNDVQSNSVVKVPYASFTSEYRAYLQDIVVDYELQEDEYNLYKQNPHALSYALYGVTHYWAMLLELNHCRSRIDFTKKKIKVFDPSKLEDIITEIMTKEGLLT